MLIRIFSGHLEYDLCNCRTSSRAHTKYVILWVDYQFIRMGGTILPHWMSILHMVSFMDILGVQQSKRAPKDIKGIPRMMKS